MALYGVRMSVTAHDPCNSTRLYVVTPAVFPFFLEGLVGCVWTHVDALRTSWERRGHEVLFCRRDTRVGSVLGEERAAMTEKTIGAVGAR